MMAGCDDSEIVSIGKGACCEGGGMWWKGGRSYRTSARERSVSAGECGSEAMPSDCEPS